MSNWFLTKISYSTIMEDGKEKKTTEEYLIDAITFTEAESRIIKEMEPRLDGEFIIQSIKREKINEIFYDETSDKWFKAKVAFISFDEEKGTEKETKVTMYTQAENLNQARTSLEEGMKGTMYNWKIKKLEETKIYEVIKYKNEEEV